MPTAYVTCPPEWADDIAETIVEEQLAACVNRVDCQSLYRWDGEIHDEAEVILFCKTTAEAFDALATRIDQLHPHDVPCIERFDERDIADPFADWIADSVRVE